MTAPSTRNGANQRTFAERRRHAVIASWQGLYLDFIDIFAPVIALAPAMIYFTSADMPPEEATLIYYLSFFATLIGRPVGSFIFGPIADRYGRRRMTLISVGGFTVCTLAIGLLPGYASVGLLAPILLVALRFLDGIFLGGEYTSATPMAYEYIGKNRRGFFGGVLQATYPSAYVTVSIVTLLVFLIAPAGDIDAPYTQWGWRIVFIASAIASAIFFIYRFNNLPESEAWEKSAKAKSPVKEVLFGPNRKDFWQTFVLMTGFWFLSASTVSVIPNILLTRYEVSSTGVTWMLLIAHLVLIASFIGVGTLGQRTGRRPLIIVLGVISMTASAGMWTLFASQPTNDPFLTGLMVVATVVLGVSAWGTALTYCNERFATNVRSSGFGLAYSLAIIIPSLFPFYSAWLGTIIPVQYVTGICYFVGGLFMVVGAVWGPETKNVDLGQELGDNEAADMPAATVKENA